MASKKPWDEKVSALKKECIPSFRVSVLFVYFSSQFELSNSKCTVSFKDPFFLRVQYGDVSLIIQVSIVLYVHLSTQIKDGGGLALSAEGVFFTLPLSPVHRFTCE
jgi:hypothetical protein